MSNIHPETGEVTEESLVQSKNALVEIFTGISAKPVNHEQAAILLANVDPDDLDILPTGEVYLPQIKYRQRLNEAFGPGGWAMRPLSQPYIQDDLAIQEWALYANGQFIAYAVGGAEYQPSNNRMKWSDVLETVKSNALMRLCKDLGVAAECWDKRYGEQFKTQYCIQVYRKKTNRPQWRRIDAEPWWDETGIVEKKQQASSKSPQDNPPDPPQEATPAKEQPAKNGKPKSHPVPVEGPDPWPAKSGPVANFCNQVQRLTNGYYGSQYQLANALEGKFGNLSDPDTYNAKVNEAVAHAKKREAEKAAGNK